jgi:alkylhydroperoxidase family enzyme
MSRIPGINPEHATGYVAKILEGQARTWGAALANHLVYAHRPDLFRAVRGMWTAFDKDGILGPQLVSLVNRRVASLNGCVF